jgi:hypothetical protein
MLRNSMKFFCTINCTKIREDLNNYYEMVNLRYNKEIQKYN